MSRAFVKEDDAESVNDAAPLRIQSDAPNYITPAGHLGLQEKVNSLRQQHTELSQSGEQLSKKSDLQRLDQEINWYQERLGRAIVVEPQVQTPGQLVFGMTVELRDERQNHYRFTIVGEDEVDLDSGCISWTSPLAQQLLGCAVDDEISWQRDSETLVLTALTLSYSSSTPNS